MAKGIGGNGGGGKDPKSKIGQMMNKIKSAGQSKKSMKSPQQSCGSMLSGIANAAKGDEC